MQQNSDIQSVISRFQQLTMGANFTSEQRYTADEAVRTIFTASYTNHTEENYVSGN